MTSAADPFILAATVIVALGIAVTVPALVDQWNDKHGKPFVFGFDAAATHFLGLLSYLVLALVTTGRLTTRRTTAISAMMFLPIAIFSASLVRFTFIALASSLCLATLFSEAKQRKHIIAIGFVIFLGIVAGLAARHSKTNIYVSFALEETYSDVNQDKLGDKPPSCYHEVNPDNSIAIRKALIRDALFLIPSAGWLGTGLDSFMLLSCIKQTEIHNSILQATVEFGWLGGALLVLVIVVTIRSVASLARQDGASRFVLSSLVFVVLMSLAHGRISRDAVIFAFLGCAVGLKETDRAART